MANSPHLLGYSRMGMELTKGEVGWREQSDFGTGFEGERGAFLFLSTRAGAAAEDGNDRYIARSLAPQRSTRPLTSLSLIANIFSNFVHILLCHLWYTTSALSSSTINTIFSVFRYPITRILRTVLAWSAHFLFPNAGALLISVSTPCLPRYVLHLFTLRNSITFALLAITFLAFAWCLFCHLACCIHWCPCWAGNCRPSRALSSSSVTLNMRYTMGCEMEGIWFWRPTQSLT
ncbi:uncharacterized protein C8R40DRAFT_510710 [Lentinula edodes]|uniref:uncharacterized protein n=1 Tax=Lentinula edodes TaxID=5353 RepID=UPI001E8E51F4|nr:uncharacterized protein C8R40DRAFT_510710 [Lentinula edodes]KAH7872232.1 hypothetical protein C8R40DRAFT_510710 [Lentinula edodes]